MVGLTHSAGNVSEMTLQSPEITETLHCRTSLIAEDIEMEVSRERRAIGLNWHIVRAGTKPVRTARDYLLKADVKLTNDPDLCGCCAVDVYSAWQ